jgi:hypothetical protein
VLVYRRARGVGLAGAHAREDHERLGRHAGH